MLFGSLIKISPCESESSKEVLVGLGFAYPEMQFKTAQKKVSTHLCNATLMRMFLVKWMSLVVNTGSGRDGFLLQQKSSAAGFHSKLWNNDKGRSQPCSYSVQYVSSDLSRCAVA